MLRRIFSFIPKKLCFRYPGSVAVSHSTINEEILKSKFMNKETKFGINLSEHCTKSKYSTFRKTAAEELYVWCSGVLVVSTIIYWHKLLNQSCPYKKIDNEVLSILKKLVLHDNIVLAVNVGPRISDEPAASLNDSCNQSWESTKANFKKTVEECSALLYNKMAMEMSRSNGHKMAFDLFVKASENGNVASLFNIGLCYELGHGVKVSLEKAAEYYKFAADKGHLKAMYNLSSLYYQGLLSKYNSDENGFYYMKLAADNGLVKAQLKMGLIYTEEKRWSDAVKYFEMAASQEDAASEYYLAICCDNGFGIKQDTKKAMEHYKKAAEMGYADAQYVVGRCYENGLKECTKDLINALKWYKLAQKSGYTEIEDRIELLEYEIKQRSEDILLDALDLNPIMKIFSPVEKHIRAIHKSSSAPSLRPC